MLRASHLCCRFPPADVIYGGNRHDVLFRCALLTKAALEAPCVVPCGSGEPYGGRAARVCVCTGCRCFVCAVRCVKAFLTAAELARHSGVSGDKFRRLAAPALRSKAGARNVDFERAPYRAGESNLVFIANDWHTALLPVYLQVGPYGGRMPWRAAAAAVPTRVAITMSTLCD